MAKYVQFIGPHRLPKFWAKGQKEPLRWLSEPLISKLDDICNQTKRRNFTDGFGHSTTFYKLDTLKTFFSGQCIWLVGQDYEKMGLIENNLAKDKNAIKMEILPNEKLRNH